MNRQNVVARRDWLKLVMAGFLGMMAAGCGGATAPATTTAPGAVAPPKKPEAQRLTVGLSSLPLHFDPLRQSTQIDVLGQAAVFDSLTELDEKGAPQPQLATSWKLVDPTTWEFKLRTGVKFQTGEPFDAEVVKWNVDRLVDPKFVPSMRNKVPLLSSARVISSDTVQLTTSAPDPIFPRRLPTLFLMAPGHYHQVGENEFRIKPSGTGPWRVKTFLKDERIVLERFEGSWRGVPKLAEVAMVSMPEGSTRVAALKTGEIDIASYLPTDQAEALRQAGFPVKSVIVQRIHIIVLDATKDSPVKDKRVRLALNYAVDKESLIRNIMQGHARIQDGQMVGPTWFGYNPKLKAYPYDPAKAKQLLAEAGFPNGFSTGMNSSFGGNLNDKETAEAIVGYFGEVGIQAKLELAEWNDHIKKRQEGKLYPIYFHAYSNPAADADFTLQWWDSKKTAAKTPTYGNPEYDKAFWASQTEMDPDKRLKLLQQASEVLHEDPPVIFLFHPADVYALSKNVQGFEPRPDTKIVWDSVSKAG